MLSFAHSFSFQKENAMFCSPWVSETPAIPSSPHLKTLDRASSWVKSTFRQYKLERSRVLSSSLTRPRITISTVILANWGLISMSSCYLHGFSHTCCPLSLSDVRTPFLPVLGALSVLLQTLLHLRKVLVLVNLDHLCAMVFFALLLGLVCFSYRTL